MSDDDLHYTDPETDTSSTGKLRYEDLLLKQFDAIRQASNSNDLDKYGAAIEELIIELYPSILSDNEIKENLENLEKKRDQKLKALPKRFDRDFGSYRVNEAEQQMIWKEYYRAVHKQLFILLNKLGLLLEQYLYEEYK